MPDDISDTHSREFQAFKTHKCMEGNHYEHLQK